MARMLSGPQVLRIAAEIGAIPASAEITPRKRSALWRRGELEVVCRLEKEQGQILTCYTFIGDAKLGPAMTEYGRLSVSIRGLIDDVIEWPTRSSTQLEEFLRENLGKASEFILDREDLCLVLASDDDVPRGRLYAWLPRASYPARLVEALIIARDMGSSRLVSMIEEKLHGSPVVLSNGDRIEILPEARYWAKEFEKALGAEIDL
jgi:hypothetical protein